MTSIYQRALGQDFAKLHPKMQERFGLSAADHTAAIGTGVMDRIWHGPLFTLPALWLGSLRHITSPSRGENVPFRVESYFYQDRFGRETMSIIRRFQFPAILRRIDSTSIYSRQRNGLVDYLGSHQNLAADIHASVTGQGGIQMHSDAQRFYEGLLGFRVPMRFSGYVDLHEWYDDVVERFRIRVVVSNPIFGKLFGYTGSFTVEYRPMNEVPSEVKPIHSRPRE